MASQDVFDKEWPEVYIQALLTKAQATKSEDDDTRVLSKDLFDDLVKIVEVVNRVNLVPQGVSQIIVEPSKNGCRVQVKGELTPDATAEGRTVIEALLHGLRKKEAQTNTLLQ